jgi:class 3 adenylate cyclase
MESRLMTIVFLDMQGYTKRSAKQTIEEMKLFHDQMFKFVADIVDKWNGIMVKSMGDGFMVRFESPTNAVQAGIEIQRKLDARNAQMMNPASIVRFRVGINTGEVGMDENGDLFGDPVNIASRIQTFADTNDVFISESTFLAMNQNEFGAVDLGAQELKNATREIRIYKVLKNGSPGLMFHKPPEIEPQKISRSKKIAFAALAVVVLLAGFLLVRKVVRSRNRNPAQAREQQESITILDLQPDDKRLNFDGGEMLAFSELKKLLAENKFAESEKIAIHMIKRQPVAKKVLWGMVLAELFYKQNETDKARKMCQNLLKRPEMPEKAKKLIELQVERLQKKYEK